LRLNAVPVVARSPSVFGDAQPGSLDSRFTITDSSRAPAVGSKDFRRLKEPGAFELALKRGADGALIVRFERNAFSVMRQSINRNTLYREPPRPLSREEKHHLRDLLARSATTYAEAIKKLNADLRRKPVLEARQFGSSSKSQAVTATSLEVYGPSVPRRFEDDHFRNARIAVTLTSQGPGAPVKPMAVRVVDDAGVVVATIKGSELAQVARDGTTHLTATRLPTGLFVDDRSYRIVVDFGRAAPSLQGPLRAPVRWASGLIGVR